METLLVLVECPFVGPFYFFSGWGNEGLGSRRSDVKEWEVGKRRGPLSINDVTHLWPLQVIRHTPWGGGGVRCSVTPMLNLNS